MIKAEELMIGNYVMRQSSKMVVNRHSLYQIEVVTKQTESKYEPIPLTEEWLIKLGLTRLQHEYCRYSKLRYFGVKFINNKFSYNPANINMVTYLIYVHQLQNLYYALTGEKLTIKKQ